jgi:tetratricopeptide (TPR) repeat protein
MEPLERAFSLKKGYTDFLPDLLILLGRCCVENNLPKGQSYLQALRRYRSFASSPEIYNSLGILARKQGHYDRAREWFFDALAKDPDNAVVLQNIAVLYDVYLGKPDLARKFYVRSLAARQHIRDITNQAEIRRRLKQLRRVRLQPATPTP